MQACLSGRYPKKKDIFEAKDGHNINLMSVIAGPRVMQLSSWPAPRCASKILRLHIWLAAKWAGWEAACHNGNYWHINQPYAWWCQSKLFYFGILFNADVVSTRIDVCDTLVIHTTSL